jgi:uncharacterized phage protein gp47/JayE
MSTRPALQPDWLDPRDAQAWLAAILARRAGYAPEWLAPQASAGAALAAIAARYLETVAQRLDQMPDKLKLAFLDLAGLSLIPAQEARAPVVFSLNDQAAGGSAPSRTVLGAAPPHGESQQILFETERAVGVTAGKIKQIVSLWPGRDEYIDHSDAFAAGAPIEPFADALRQPVPHQLFISHPVLLALAGKVDLAVEFELQSGATTHLDLIWEYWDGQTWRGFRSSSTECGLQEAIDADSTDGLRQSGSYRLSTDCAAAQKVRVNDIDGYWLRARLTDPLPPDPLEALPQVDMIRLSSTVNGALRGRIAVAEPTTGSGAAGGLAATGTPSATPSLQGHVLNDAGQPVQGAIVYLSAVGATDDRPAYSSQETGKEGAWSIPNVNLSVRYLYEVTFADIRFTGPVSERQPTEPASAAKPSVDLTLYIEGVAPDKAFADATSLDVSKAFYPLGQQPQPGTTFYFTNEEAFSKPLAKVRVYLARTRSPQDEGALSDAQDLEHQTDWEYWNGRRWAPLVVTSNFAGSKLDLDRTEVLAFTVPLDMETVSVNDQQARWVRVRLHSGAYGVRQTVTFKTDSAPAATGTIFGTTVSTIATVSTSSFTYIVTRPPVLASFAIGYTWQYGPFHAERVLAWNDFAYADRTDEAMWPGSTFAPFDRVTDLTPALYMGFDKAPPVDQLGLFFDIVEMPRGAAGPALVWEYWAASREWRRTPAEDETGYLARPGIVTVLAQPDDAELARFGTPLHWIRARLKEDGSPARPVVRGIWPNAVWASERHTLTDLPTGASNGTPNQLFTLTQTPVLAGERIEVRELSGARANVEWRILAMELFGGNNDTLAALEQMLAHESVDTDISLDPLRLKRNRQKQVVEAWVRWERHDQLFFSGPQDRHYVLDGATGRLGFGDGANGRVPPAGAAILVRSMSVGGGSKGNVEANTINQLLGVVPGIQSVFNPRAAEGGADGERGPAVLQRGPNTVRHRGRALAPQDYEALAIEASPAVRIARAIAGLSETGRTLPGWVTVMIIPFGKEAQPYPSFGLREEVRRYIEARACADIAALHRVQVTGPAYLPIGVTATVVPLDPSQAGAVEESVRATIERFLHPLFGGPNGAGWDLGRDVFISDIAAQLERTLGVDYIEDLALVMNGVPQGESVLVADNEVVCAGVIQLRLGESGG